MSSIDSDCTGQEFAGSLPLLRADAAPRAVLAGGQEISADDGSRRILNVPSTLVARLILCLQNSGIRFCHWKSNIRLRDTLEGDEDVDLLVDRRDAIAFQAALDEYGFKLAHSRFGTDHPGVFHAIGLDDTTGQLADVHAYYHVVSGDSFVKNYRLPVDADLIEGRREIMGVPVPRPEAELVLFVMRIVLKHLSPIEILKSNRHYNKIVTELEWLRMRADPDVAAALCTTWFPFVDQALFRDALDAVGRKRGLGRRIFVGARLAWRLRGLRRLGFVSALCSRAARLIAFALVRLQGRRELVPRSGGLIVALVGPKATGKSTVGRLLAQRLGKHLDVVRIHAGKPPATLMSALPRLFVPLARSLLPSERLAEYEKPERRQERRYSLLYVLRMTLLAFDRRRLLRRALRRATSGSIVISDRYPSDAAGAIDSSCFDDESIMRAGPGLKRYLMKWERRLYEGLPKPDLVLRLQSPLETALQRDRLRQKEGGPDAASVLRRWQLESGTQFKGVRTVLIDTGQPLEQTALAAIKAVWSAV